MKKLIYLIVVIVAFGLIVSGCLPVVPPVEQDEPGALPNKGVGDVFYVPTSAYPTIQDAINTATGGEIIIVTTEIHNEGIVIIDKNLTIIGGGTSGKTTINPTTDTGTANAIGLGGRGWFQIWDSATVTFNNLVFDGTGKKIYTAVHYHGDSAGGTVENCDFMNIRHGIYDGRGINNYGNHVDVLDCTFTNIGRIGVFTFSPSADTLIKGCTYTGKGDGDVLDYAFEVGGSAAITVEGCTITECTASGSGWGSAGILVTSLWGPTPQATITGNDIHSNSEGVSIGYDDSDTSTVTLTSNDIHNNDVGVYIRSDGNTVIGIHNNIYDNVNYGVEVHSCCTATYDFECNWWGADNGPGVVGPGDGDKVSVNVNYNPWLTKTSILVYSGAPQPETSVVLEATLSDSTLAVISEMDVDFYLGDRWVGSATTDSNGVASCGIGSHEVGIYEVYAETACDLKSETEYLAVYPLSEGSGFVTGGGWIDSPAGAYVSDPSAEGKASFGFVSKYKKGQSEPTGNTEFQFKAGNLNFHSDNYDWLVVAGDKAMYKGTGTINGAGEYGFMLSATDSDPDLFRIKIQDKTTNIVIYDNKQDGNDGTELGGGQIIIHKGK